MFTLYARPTSGECSCRDSFFFVSLSYISSSHTQEDMTRTEDLTTKLRTLSYDYERLRTMHSAATETAESAEREAAAARAKLT